MDSLGDITSELKPCEYIADILSGEPMNYAYRIIDIKDDAKQPKIVCKFGAITLNYTASQLVKFDVIRDMILNREPDTFVTVHCKIQRKRKLGGVISIITETEDKI